MTPRPKKLPNLEWTLKLSVYFPTHMALCVEEEAATVLSCLHLQLSFHGKFRIIHHSNGVYLEKACRDIKCYLT